MIKYNITPRKSTHHTFSLCFYEQEQYNKVVKTEPVH